MDVPHAEVDLFEPLTRGQKKWQDDPDEHGNRVPAPVFLHLYETCPSVKSAVRRDGETLRSHGYLDEVMMREPKMPLCSWCARRFRPGVGLWWA